MTNSYTDSSQDIMNARVERLLLRMRCTLPFPIPIGLFLKSVYPEPLLSSSDPSWNNLTACLYLGETAHFHVEGREQRVDETFWVRHPEGKPLPTPKELHNTLFVDRHNPYFRVVGTWMTDALAIQRDINLAEMYVSDFIRSVKYPSHVKHHWPELYAFVGGPGLTSGDTKKLMAAVGVPENVRDDVTTLLAKCSLLTDSTCLAWVQYPRRHT